LSPSITAASQRVTWQYDVIALATGTMPLAST
jgi:hypothetical protein